MSVLVKATEQERFPRWRPRANIKKLRRVLLLPLANFPSLSNLVFHLSTFADGTDVLKKEETKDSASRKATLNSVY